MKKIMRKDRTSHARGRSEDARSERVANVGGATEVHVARVYRVLVEPLGALSEIGWGWEASGRSLYAEDV